MDYGNFIDVVMLQEMYVVLGVDGSKFIGVYCGVGMLVVYMVLVFVLIGIMVFMYFGFWFEWIYDLVCLVVRGVRFYDVSINFRQESEVIK